MFAVAGYYENQFSEKTVSEVDFFVHCCGHYRLVRKNDFRTDRDNGTYNFQLLYVAEGQAHFRIGEQWHVVTKGECVLYRPKERQHYYYKLEEKPDIYWVHFSVHEENKLWQQTGWKDKHIFTAGSHSSYIQLFETMIQELQLKQAFCEEQLQLVMQQLLLKMSRNQIREQSYFESYNREVEEAIREFHREPERQFTIKEYVQNRGLNYYRFIDTFTKYTGTSPRQYIIDIRMNMAKDFLSSSHFQIAEVAELVGYDNPLYFSRLFKKRWGISPSDCKKNHEMS